MRFLWLSLCLLSLSCLASPGLAQEVAYTQLENAPAFDAEVVPTSYPSQETWTVVPQTIVRQHNPWQGGVDVGITEITYRNSAWRLDSESVGVSLAPYLGWESVGGVGIRGRLWVFGDDNTAFPTSATAPFDVNVGAVKFDLDFYKRITVDNTSFVLGVGNRAALLIFDYPGNTEETHSAGGLSAFIEGQHKFHQTDVSTWSILGGARISYLVGESEFDNGLNLSIVDNTFTIGSANLGVEYRRHFERSDFIFQLDSQIELWQISSVGDPAFSTTNFRLGMEW